MSILCYRVAVLHSLPVLLFGRSNSTTTSPSDSDFVLVTYQISRITLFHKANPLSPKIIQASIKATHFKMLFTTATLLATLAMSASAQKTGRTFAVNHFYGNGPLTVGRMDPIVSPGGPSGHHHTIQGGSNFALTMTDTQLLSSSCTSALVKNDNSNYWTPSLFFQDPQTGEFTPVPMFYMNVYYL